MQYDLTRRRFLAQTGAAAAALSVAGQATTAAEARFTMSSAGGTWGEYLRNTMIVGTKFESMDVAYEEGGDSVRLAKLIASRSNPAVTVANFLTPEQYMAAEASAVQSYDTDIVTNLSKIYPAAVPAPVAGLANWSAPFSIAMTGMVWNTNEVNSKPTTWLDLWNKDYKGRIGIPDYGWIGISWIHALNHELGGSEDNIDAAIEALIDLRENYDAVVIGSTDQASKAMTTGEIVMLPWFNGRAFELQSKGLPIDIAYVNNAVLQNNGFLIANGTAFPTEANEFIQRSLEAEVQLKFAQLTRYAPANMEVKLPPEFERYAIPASAIDNAAPIDWIKLNQYRGDYLKRWTEEVLG